VPIQPVVEAPAIKKDGDFDVEVNVLADGTLHNAERIERAKQDAAVQASLSVREGIHKYRDAVLWSALMTLTVAMEAYDYGLIGSLFGFPAFAERFGDRLPNGTYNVRYGFILCHPLGALSQRFTCPGLAHEHTTELQVTV
jgi:hypothetical protein